MVRGWGEGVSRGPGPSLGAVSGDLHPPEAADGQAPPPQGPVRVLHAPVSLQSEEKFRCVSDSQCQPERFPGVGECSFFPTSHCPALSVGPWGQHVPPRREATLREGAGMGLFYVTLPALLDAGCGPAQRGCPQSPQARDGAADRCAMRWQVLSRRYRGTPGWGVGGGEGERLVPGG